MTEGVSVVICTYNGSQVLEDTLKHLFAQQSINFPLEVIVVDNNSSDKTYSEAQKWLEDCPFDHSLLSEKKQGKANASRTGFDAAQYSITLVCDDDNRLDPTYLSKGFGLMRKNGNIGVLGGMGIPETTVDLPDWFADYEQIYAVGKQSVDEGVVTDKIDFIWGAGMFFRTEVWHAIREFKPTFYLNEQRGKVNMGGDDVELCEFARWCGFDLYVDHSLTFKHRIPDNRINTDFIRSRFKGLGASSVILQMYIQVRKGNLHALEYTGRFPYWLDRVIHLTKALSTNLENLSNWISGKDLNSRLVFLADVSRIRMFFQLRKEYIPIMKDLLAKKSELEMQFSSTTTKNI